jgi:hypothetical protein
MDESNFEIVEVPRRCAGCGQDADASGMRHVGWAVPRSQTGDTRAYCLGCASVLRFLPWTAQCAGCGREVDDENEAEAKGWRFFLDGDRELTPMCADCAAIEARRRSVA